MRNLKFRRYIAIFLPLLILLIGLVFPVISKVIDSRRLQETNFELSVLEFKGENFDSAVNPAKAFFKYGEKLIPLKIVNKDLDIRIVVELPRFPAEVGSHFLAGSLLISGGEVTQQNPQTFPILLVRQPTANTRLEKMNQQIAEADGDYEYESPVSKEVGRMISQLQNQFKTKKVDFGTDTKRMKTNFKELNKEINKLNVAFDSTLEELENIDQELTKNLS